MRKILVTGGAGYIGSHTCVSLAAANVPFVILDNFSNSSEKVLSRLESITRSSIEVEKGDIRDAKFLQDVFERNKYSSVIHFAGLKSVSESSDIPDLYYENNVSGTINLIRSMIDNDVKSLIFSSSATVYGVPNQCPVTEDFPLSATNPYGRTKLMVEEILADLYKSDPSWSIACLRYFNPIGAHESGTIGESPKGIPNNIAPYITQVAIGVRNNLKIFGSDYPTKDGTGVRDYIHVMDLAEAHLAALNYLMRERKHVAFNIGTGSGISVLELVSAFELATKKTIPWVLTDRRSGDIAECWADPAHANKELGWVATRDINVMCRDAWKWQKNNPNGY